MEFQLKKQRNISDAELIRDMQDVSQKLNKDTITIEEYDQYGIYNSSTLRRRFGSWAICLQKANLRSSKINYSNVTRKDILQDIIRVAKILNKTNLTAKDYDKYGKFNHYKIVRLFHSWNNAIIEAGLYCNISKHLTEEDLFNNLLNVWQKLGRQPYYREMRQPLSICSAKPYVTKFGSWYKTLEQFIEYMNKDTNNEDCKQASEIVVQDNINDSEYIHKTARNINLRLRYLVLKRDNFKCVICGRSPAKDPKIELQVDHIIPWSKGGETTVENLRTLCSECNLGKSDIY